MGKRRVDRAAQPLHASGGRPGQLMRIAAAFATGGMLLAGQLSFAQDIVPSGASAPASSATIREIRVEGVTVLDPEVVASITDPYIGAKLEAENVVAIRQALTLAYIDAGYFSSGAVVEAQDVVSGVVTLRAVEGRLGEVTITGLENRRIGQPRASYVGRAVRPLRNEPLSAGGVERAFRRLTSDPSFESVTGRVEPAPERGFADLHLEVAPARTFSATVALANDRSPATGSERLSFTVGARDLVGYGDLLEIDVGATEGSVDGYGSFSAPLPWAGGELHVRAAASEVEVIEEPFTELDLLSETVVFGGGGSFAVTEGAGHAFRLGVDVTRVEAQSSLLGTDFSLSPGARDGRTEYLVARLNQTFQIGGRRQLLVLSSTFSVGLDAIAPEFTDEFTPPEDFQAWFGQVKHATRATQSGQQLEVRVDVRATSDPAFATEKFSLGGPGSVRGYRTNSVVSDAGALASAEYSVPLTDLGVPSTASLGPLKLRDVTLSGFVDTGLAWNADQEVSEGVDLSGVGVSVEWRRRDAFGARLELAAGVSGGPPDLEETLQDYGVTFELFARLF